MHMLSIGKVLLMRVKMYRLGRAKTIALDISRNRTPYISFIDRLHYWNAKYLHCGCIKTHFRVNRNKPYIVKLFKLYITATTTGTFPNFILTAIFGFLGGVLLSYVYFTMCVIVLDLETWTVFYISVFLSAFLTLGLAFYQGVRCIVLSILPELCTSRARAMLISIALFAVISGPGSNILFNTKQLTNTIACTQEQVGAIGHNLTELYKKPLRIIKQGILLLIKSIKPIIDKLKSFLIWIKNAIIKIGKMMKKVFSWLKIFAFSCHTRFGTPAELCQQKIEVWVRDCEAALGFFGGICNPFELITMICVPMKAISAVCNFKDFIQEHVFDYLKGKLKDLGHFLKTIFYVKVSFHHSFSFKTNQSKSLKDIYRDVHESQERRLKLFLGVMHIMKLILTTYIAYVLLTALIYRYRFFYQARYDNRHVNRFLVELDTKRATVNRQTLFPLTIAEKSHYVSLFSLRMTSSERKSFLRGSAILFLACLKTAFIFVIDIFLYFILDLVHNHGRISFYFGRDKSIIGAEGAGFFYTLYNIFNGLFNVFDIELRFDTTPCLPQPIPINKLIYERIMITLAFAWLMSLLQPFALRFRNYVMSIYYPEIARKRAVWMYNQILQTRGVISQYVRRTLFTRGAIGLRSEKPDAYKWIIARFPRLYFFLPFRNLYKECIVCGYKNPKVRCATPQCTGMYDEECFESLNNTCLICNMPQNFKGMDVSEEEDSDGETDPTMSKTEPPKPWWKFWIQVNPSHSIISMEEGTTLGEPDQTIVDSSSAPSTSGLQPSKDYFSDQWRRDDWASLDDYDIPDPDMGSWTRPHFTTKTPLSPKI